MKILINYADDKYKKTQKFNSFTGKYIGNFDKVYSFGPEDIDNEFYEDNKKIFNIPRGNGLWLWKPYFIKKIMNETNDGDIIFYCDSGAFFINNIQPLIDSIDHKYKIWVSDLPLLEENFTKKNCFNLMGCNHEKYKSTNQIQATFFMAINSDETRSFVNEWLELCEDIELLAPVEDITLEESDFIAHREDQSILSLHCKKNRIPVHRDPSQRGKLPYWYKNEDYPFVLQNHTDNYRTILFLHKLPTVNVVKCLKQYLMCLKKTFLHNLYSRLNYNK